MTPEQEAAIRKAAREYTIASERWNAMRRMDTPLDYEERLAAAEELVIAQVKLDEAGRALAKAKELLP